ncbi:hypothetical protein ACTU6V_11155 [Microbacterium sp. A204]|uniref:hypothetical protein n=1 Tax=Microbacterium sp. A204 TaxID=3457321 RepID=UPI003FD1014A
MTRGRIIAAIAVAAGAALILLFGLRVEPVFAFSWAAIAGVIVVSTQLVIPEDARVDAPDIPIRREQRGTDVSRMAWSLNPRTGEAGELATRRVRGVLGRRLLRSGLSIDEPMHRAQINALIGDGLWDRLSGPGTKIQDVERALTVIDSLAANKEEQ